MYGEPPLFRSRGYWGMGKDEITSYPGGKVKKMQESKKNLWMGRVREREEVVGGIRNVMLVVQLVQWKLEFEWLRD